MKVLIVGASSAQSIGVRIGQALACEGHTIVVASRTGALGGPACNLAEETLVTKTLNQVRPCVIVHAAGVYTPAGRIGFVRRDELKYVRQNIVAKSHGAFVLSNVASKVGCVRSIIFLGGRTMSSDPNMTADCMANAALLALVKMGSACQKSNLRYHYLDLPLVSDSAMGVRFTEENPGLDVADAITCAGVANVVRDIVNGAEARDYIKLGEGWTI